MRLSYSSGSKSPSSSSSHCVAAYQASAKHPARDVCASTQINGRTHPTPAQDQHAALHATHLVILVVKCLSHAPVILLWVKVTLQQLIQQPSKLGTALTSAAAAAAALGSLACCCCCWLGCRLDACLLLDSRKPGWMAAEDDRLVP
jgi:hypothetical protein